MTPPRKDASLSGSNNVEGQPPPHATSPSTTTWQPTAWQPKAETAQVPRSPLRIFSLSFSSAQKGASLSLMGHSPATHRVFSFHQRPTFPVQRSFPLHCKHSVFSQSQTVFPILKVTFRAPACPPTLVNASLCAQGLSLKPQMLSLISLFFTPCLSHTGTLLTISGPEYLPHLPTSHPLTSCLEHLCGVQTGPPLPLLVHDLGPSQEPEDCEVYSGHLPPCLGPVQGSPEPQDEFEAPSVQATTYPTFILTSLQLL